MPPQPSTPPLAPSLRQAAAYWLELGCISFGGPAGQIALMHEELVVRRRWVSERRFLHALNFCMLLPGPEAQQLATYLGWLLHRTPGALVAGGLFVLPSLALLIGLSWAYLAWGTLPLVAGVFAAIKPAVVALVAVAAWRIGRRTLRNRWLVAIAGAAFAALSAGLPFALILLAAALAGLAGGHWAPQHFAPGGGHAAAPSAGAALIDDDTPPPPHARFSRGRLARVLGVGLGLGAAGLAVLALNFGWQGTLTQMGAFFTQAALLTFGGAYAVLPFVHQGAVVEHGWLTSAQMLDGLALGETTPGPLIMVVAFVGFVGGWTKAFFGPEALALAGVAGALVATAFTFLPSFVFILAGGPFIESSRHRPRLTAPLTAITAAVVGVIAHLAVFLAGHAIWPAGLDVVALGIAATAAVALLRFGLGPVAVVLAAGAWGALRVLLG